MSNLMMPVMHPEQQEMMVILHTGDLEQHGTLHC
jgi:hypothetical protein